MLRALTLNHPVQPKDYETVLEHFLGTYIVHLDGLLGIWTGDPKIVHVSGIRVTDSPITDVLSSPGWLETDLDAQASDAAQQTSHAVKFLPLANLLGAVPGSTFYATKLLSVGEIIVRFTASPHDGQFVGGSLRAGCYFTSPNDAAQVPNGFAAVGRYAIPSPLPACHLHIYRLRARCVAHLGTARPLFGQAGGGSEGRLHTAVAATRIGQPIPAPLRSPLPLY